MISDPLSSMRETPSAAVVWAVKQLRQQHLQLRTAIDVGCGYGRNSLYLAGEGLAVTAMDITPNAIAELQARAATAGLTDKIRPLVYDATDPWPVPPDSADLIIDTFCFKHITGRDYRQGYRNSMLRALRLHGYYLISFASIGDGYYSQYLQVPPDMAAEIGSTIVMDPARNAESVLFTPDHVMEFFAPELTLLATLKQDKPMMKHGKLYARETFALLLRRNPHHYVA